MCQQAQCFNRGQVEALSKALGNYMTGSEISKLLCQCGIDDNSNQTTKWRRLDYCFIERQNKDRSPNAILRFIKEALQPVLFMNDSDKYEAFRTDVNQVILTAGLEIQRDGNLCFAVAATTIDEVKHRTQNLERMLRQRCVHECVLKYCKEELLQENYFHAVFEATKSLSDRVRELTSLSLDGYKLFDEAFKISNPYLAMNKLQTSSEQNQQNGLHQMLNGVTSMVRNVTAHEPKIKWLINESDAVDILCTISFLHKQLDQCIVVPHFTA
ncbi:uncharacterized protein (TIGR02391 family) [Hydrogenoanaerobacterium saccharovorans]|uniref:TIGR02391 family protein n=1 Tax=Hydrogenoanaerobacterium saccharovorans TaxID=474960 RepID=A0A1H8BMG5_9FIRM|nr:TIGR02391 family protein [Hydrogenoanaerobacterium saccharovorans]RPF47327.1 uncharacterized protein (TIGR02391 family) [Hydrogenoanaerobacterium saccharovorans]SEM84091.1 TIGR02391 family protein [Hydrogenoanaerobacterium saccharovorans]